MPRVATILFATSLLACALPGECQTGRRQVEVVLESQQQGQDSRQSAPRLAVLDDDPTTSELSFVLTASVQ